ncbi:S-layer homology domain-containing protein, partial [uncultured Selenomonas sp.]|uniref:S-layer homology domain-containing protein n=1 Tax=uncultured Selenomonas sp. TaxID=159275 RepID=UPI002601C995
MKKVVCGALLSAAALLGSCGADAAAAANPFSDVPADHWAYDAVAQLAADGVIEGYGDGTYRGEKSITRYEMAQMVAKGMARMEIADARDKALLDRLAAEFADELSNLGVRVDNLEQRIDNVRW